MSAQAVGLLLNVSAQIVVRQARAEPFATVVRGIILIAIVFALVAAVAHAAHSVVMIAGFVLAFVPGRIRMLRILREVSLGWPSSLAISGLARYALAWCQALGPVLMVLAAVALLAWLQGQDASMIAFAMLAVIAGGLAAGVWLRTASLQRYPDSRYRRSTPEAEARFNLKPIAQDLHALVAANMRPAVLVKVAVPLFLIVPNQIPIQALMLLILFSTAAAYASFLLGALGGFFERTRDWLASAPISRDQLKAILRQALWPRFMLIACLIYPLLAVSLGVLLGLLGLAALVAVLMIWLEVGFRRSLSAWL